MAEIKIEKKTPIWPWVLLVLAVIAILVYIFYFNDRKESNDSDVDKTEQTQEPVNNSTVTAYVNFINDDPDAMGIDHEYTNEALLKLTNATSAMADEIDYDIQKDIDEVKSYADKITDEPFETTHANSIKKAADILANVLQNIQREAFSGLTSGADEVKSAAAAIETDILTLDQKEDVKNFFRASADLLEQMNNNSPQK